ncbi:MAG: ComEC/Rec2 family competence protein [Brevinematia bacterium]
MPVVLYLLILVNSFLVYSSFLWIAIALLICFLAFFLIKREYIYLFLLLTSFFATFFNCRNNINSVNSGFIHADFIVTGFLEKKDDSSYYVEAYPFKLILESPVYLYRSQQISVAGFVRNKNLILVKEIKVKRNGFILLKIFSMVREYFTGQIEKIENKRFKSLIYAFIMGNKSQLDFETKENFRFTGLFHLLAVSGLHVGIIAMFVGFVAGLFLKRHFCYPIIAISILLYIALSGLNPSVMRAGIIFLIYFYFKMKGQNVEMLDILLFTSAISVIISPEIVFKLSFWLSYLSFAGIYFFSRPLKTFFSNLSEIFSESFSITLSANIAIFPLLLYVFKSVSLVSFISNLIVIPLFSIFLVILFLNFIIFFLSPLFCRFVFSNITEHVFDLINKIVEIFSFLPLNVEVNKFGVFQLTGFYLLIIILFFIPEISYNIRLRKLKEKLSGNNFS